VYQTILKFERDTVLGRKLKSFYFRITIYTFSC